MPTSNFTPATIATPTAPDFILALADVIRFIGKRRANANVNAATLTTDEPRAERPPAPKVKKERI